MKINNEEKISFSDSIKNLKLAFKYAAKQKSTFIAFIILSIVTSVLSVIFPFLSARQISYLNTNLFSQLIIVSLVLFVFRLIDKVLYLFLSKTQDIFMIEITRNLQLDVSKAFLNMETADINKESGGIFINRLTSDLRSVGYIFFSLNFSFSAFFTNVSVLISIFFINKIIFLYLLFGMFVIFIIRNIRSKKYHEMDKKYRKRSDRNTGFINEIVRGVHDIKVLNAEKSFIKKLENVINIEAEERYDMNHTHDIYSMISDVVYGIIELCLIILAVYLIKNNYLSAANFVVIFMYKYNALELMSTLNSLIDTYKNFSLSSSRVFKLLGSDEFRQEKFGPRKVKKIKGNIEFDNVVFSYDNKKNVLNGISFNIKDNETISIVGKSGSGKTTIFSLLSKLYSPTSGNILIDGINISELDKDSIRGNISVITQNPYIFNMSIRENFTIIKEDVTDKEIIKACKLAMLHDFISSLPEGYDTMIGEGGVNLSGGQRQRLAIARALVQNTKIILFDEATSSLDNDTQDSIQKAINNMKNKYTILIIAHRLSTIINSDKIMMLNKGKISACGTHEELMKKSKDYNKLYNLEFKKSGN